MLWQLNKPCYGLVDASRGFHLSLKSRLEETGCKSSNLDPAMFVKHSVGEGATTNLKKPVGIVVSHVDDILHAGDKDFDKLVMDPLKKLFEFGSEDEQEFRYVGMNI